MLTLPSYRKHIQLVVLLRLNVILHGRCGKVQTGRFARHAAPNGLIGLGMERISVPSFLANQGLISDSFSMCFGHDELGRIDFGDTGTPDQKETPINSNPSLLELFTSKPYSEC